MNKKQKNAYNWLLNHKGYLKCSARKGWIYYGTDNCSQENFILALKQAKDDFKASNTKQEQKPLKLQEKEVKLDFIRPKLKRLFWDIETSYNIVSCWRIGHKIDISHDNIIKERAIICVCYKWEGEDEVHYLRWKKGNDKQLLIDFVDILYQADESIGHNSDRFDLKWLRTRCAYYGIPMIPDYVTIDTLKLAKTGFNFNSNRLDYLGKFFGFGGKTETGGFKLWKEIVENNNEEAMKTMIKYCQDDVILLEKVYNKIEQYAKHKTHIGVLEGKGKCSCPKCGSEEMKKNGFRVSSLGYLKQRIKCKNCNYEFSMSKLQYDKLIN